MVSPLNILQNPFRRLNRGAFGGKMHCPYCSKHVDPTASPIGFESDKPKLRLWDTVGPFMREYKCMLCGGKFRYDINREKVHPYDSFKRGVTRDIQLPGLKHSGRVPILKKG